ncbi:TadE/TadG family type IV pilus assembly protein [Vulgatibacter incomptus]|uniref:Pilus biogenesis protein, TadE family n=1 Tax=Vulgatibacter incomptus TaxID=1391653 RepID=A0A0K1PIH7_9BACT|nr:TadE/TadG family type IV pilus assembly protein [Vulgatibacter incomptus]AKU93312.1 Pilus biogenesis protein, TadE family [Vulgatibacter incomptus]
MRVGIFQTNESGQAAVETAIVLPLFLALLLGVLQLALFHQARLLTEYAAFQAARAGAVWNGDPTKMQDAAIFALAPTACPTRVPLASRLCAPRASDSEWTRQAAGVAALQALSYADGFPGVQVHILSPYWNEHAPLFDVGPDRDELDFDLQSDEARDANVLTIQVQYWFELKIPFVDWVIWHAWVASLGGLSASAVYSSFRDQEIHRGSDYHTVRESSVRAMLAAGLSGSDRSRRAYFIPIVVHHSMRMQSNFFSRFIRGCSCAEGRGCSSECRAW